MGGTSYGQYGSSGGGGGGGGGGDVVGPASSTDNAIVRFDGTTGLLIQNSNAVLDDSGNVGFQGTVVAGQVIDSGLTVNTVPYTNSSKQFTSSAVTPTQLSFLDATSSIQTQLNAKQATGNYITALTGDVTSTGPGSVPATLVATTNATLTTLSGLTTAASLATVGTVTSGTWNATTLAINHGGTGQVTAAAAFNALSPITTTGDLIYSPSGATSQRLGIGSTGNVLTVSGGVPAWAPPATAGTVTAVSVASANGFSGSSSGGATPSLTLSTSVTSGSIVKTSTGALAAAVSGTDYSAGTSALATGILKSTTTTGALTIAASGTDYAPATSGSSILYGNGLGGFSNVTVGSGLSFITGTLSASGGGGSAAAVLTKTAAYTIVAPTDFTGGRLMVEMNAASAVTLTLPAASNTGYSVYVVNIGTAVLTIATAGSDTFGTTGDTTWTLIPGGSPNASNEFVANGGTRWNGF